MKVDRNSTVVPEVGGIIEFTAKPDSDMRDKFVKKRITDISDRVYYETLVGREGHGSKDLRDFWKFWNYDNYVITYHRNDKFEEHKQRILNAS